MPAALSSALPSSPALSCPGVSCRVRCPADELWRHLGQVGLQREDPDAAAPFGNGRHPSKILETMEHSRWGVGAGVLLLLLALCSGRGCGMLTA